MSYLFKLIKFFYLFLSKNVSPGMLADSFIIKVIDWALNFTIKTQCEQNDFIIILSQIRFMSLYQHKTDKIERTSSLHWVHSAV